MKSKHRFHKKNGRASYGISCRRTKLQQAKKRGHAIEHDREGMINGKMQKDLLLFFLFVVPKSVSCISYPDNPRPRPNLKDKIYYEIDNRYCNSYIPLFHRENLLCKYLLNATDTFMIPQTCKQIYRLRDMTSVLEKDVILQKHSQSTPRFN